MNLDICFRGILLGMKPVKLEIMPFGLSISFKLHIKDYNKKIFKSNLLEVKKIVVAASGPATNVLIAVLIKHINLDFINQDIAIYSNILIFLFNLLPIYPLDGGRIIKSIIQIILGGRIAKIATNKLSNYLMIIITVIGSISVFYFENIAIFIIVIFLWGMVINENKKFRIIIKAYN